MWLSNGKLVYFTLAFIAFLSFIALASAEKKKDPTTTTTVTQKPSPSKKETKEKSPPQKEAPKEADTQAKDTPPPEKKPPPIEENKQDAGKEASSDEAKKPEVKVEETKDKDKVSKKSPLLFDYDDSEELKPKFRARHYTVLLTPREEFCFHLNLQTDDQLTVTMKVLRGGDNKIWFFVRDSKTRKHIDPKPPTSYAVRNLKAEIDGGYEVCVNNKVSITYSKVVSLDLAISQLKDSPADYEDYGEEEEEEEDQTPDSKDYEKPERTREIQDEDTEVDDPFRQDMTKQEALDEKAIRKLQKIHNKIARNMIKGRIALVRARNKARTDQYFQGDQIARINLYSGSLCVTLILVYVGEVYFIRRMLNAKKTFVGLKIGL